MWLQFIIHYHKLLKIKITLIFKMLLFYEKYEGNIDEYIIRRRVLKASLEISQSGMV